MPIRWRLTLWFSVIIFCILAVTNVILYTQLDRFLLNEVDENLGVYSSRVHGTLLPVNIEQPIDFSVVHDRLPPINEFSSPGVYLQILDYTGQVVVKSDNLINQDLPPASELIETALGGIAIFGTVSTPDGARVRISASPLFLHDQTLVLEVAQSLKPQDTTMAQLRFALVGSVVVALVLVGVSGALLVRRAFVPVKRITDTAREIEASADLTRRVGYTGPADEMGRLATTFDHLIEHLDKVFQSQKKFIADASHELRSPLTVIRGNLELYQRYPTEENRDECLRVIESETMRMSGIVNELLLLAELESGQELRAELVPLHEIVSEEVARVQSLTTNHSVAISRIEQLNVMGNRLRLQQLLGNLLDNAIKYTPKGGKISVSLSREGNRARLEVQDTGIGIGTEHIPHLFDRFYRADKARSRNLGSTGLGLAIVKSIAVQHGAEVTVTSEPGKGSIFTVLFRL